MPVREIDVPPNSRHVEISKANSQNSFYVYYIFNSVKVKAFSFGKVSFYRLSFIKQNQRNQCRRRCRRVRRIHELQCPDRACAVVGEHV